MNTSAVTSEKCTVSVLVENAGAYTVVVYDADGVKLRETSVQVGTGGMVEVEFEQPLVLNPGAHSILVEYAYETRQSMLRLVDVFDSMAHSVTDVGLGLARWAEHIEMLNDSPPVVRRKAPWRDLEKRTPYVSNVKYTPHRKLPPAVTRFRRLGARASHNRGCLLNFCKM